MDGTRTKGNKTILAIFRLLRHLEETIRVFILEIKVLLDYFLY